MAIPKYQKQYEQMLKDHKEAFDQLKTFDTKSEDFRDMQLKLLRIIRRNEDMLCAKTENTKYSSFSTTLADKFWELIRRDYPEIDISSE